MDGHVPPAGGDFAATAYDTEVDMLKARYPFLALSHARRLVRLYGTQAASLLGHAASQADLGKHFGTDLYEVEVDWLIGQEWARRAEDVLWRRTKLGLKLTPAEIAELEDYMRGAVNAAA